MQLIEDFLRYVFGPTFIEVPVPSQETEQSCICVLRVSIFPLSTILIFDFWIVPTVWYFWIVPAVWYFWIVPTVVFLNCSDSMVFLNCSDSVVFLNCSDSVVFFVFHFILCYFFMTHEKCIVINLPLSSSLVYRYTTYIM